MDACERDPSDIFCLSDLRFSGLTGDGAWTWRGGLAGSAAGGAALSAVGSDSHGAVSARASNKVAEGEGGGVGNLGERTLTTSGNESDAGMCLRVGLSARAGGGPTTVSDDSPLVVLWR